MEKKSKHTMKRLSVVPIEASKFQEIGQELNILSNARPFKIAILELSTKAVKLLVGDMKKLIRGFDFNHFQNRSDLTNTGDYLTSNNELDIQKFSAYILPYIKKTIQYAKEQGITHLYCIATAAYRNAKNSQDILNLLQKEVNLQARIISPITEANLSLSAFLWSSAVTVAEFEKDIIMLDQGGGSIQICWFERDPEDLLYSLNTNHDFYLGTSMTKKMLLSDFPQEMNLGDAFLEVEEAVKKNMERYFKKMAQEMGANKKSCFSMGTAITSATGKTGNREQHLSRINQQQVAKLIEIQQEKIPESYPTVADLQRAMANQSETKYNNKLEHLVVMRLGLPTYLQMMQSWNIPEIVVSGTALRYGLYWQKLQEMRRHMD